MKYSLQTHRNRWGGGLLVLWLLLAYAGMAGFSTLLHNHDLDLQSTHKNCSPCKWSQTNTTNNTEASELTDSFHFQFLPIIPAEFAIQTFPRRQAIRGPPTLS